MRNPILVRIETSKVYFLKNEKRKKGTKATRRT